MSERYLFVHGSETDEATGENIRRPNKSIVKSHIRTNKVAQLKASRRACIEFKILTPTGYEQRLASKDPNQAAQASRTVTGSPSRARSPISHFYSHGRSTPSPMGILNAGNHDPFSSAALDLDPLSTHLISFITIHHASMIWPLEFSSEERVSSTRQDWKAMVRDIVMEQTQLAGFLAFGAALKLQIPGRQFHPRQDVQALERVILRNKSVAVQGVVQNLTLQPKPVVVLSTVLHLLCLEMYVPNLGVARTHLRALQSIMNAIGGVSGLPSILREYFLSISVRAAYILNEELAVELRTWDSGPLSGQTKTWDDPALASRIPQLLAASREPSLDLHSFCDTEVADLVEELREIFILEGLRDINLQEPETSNEIDRWIQPRVVSTRYRMCRLRMAQLGLLTQAVEALGIELPSPLEERIYVTLPTGTPSMNQSPLSRLRNAFLCVGATLYAAISLYRGREKLDFWGVYVEWEKWLLYCIDNFLLLRQFAVPCVETGRAMPAMDFNAEQERTDLKIALWATVSGAIAHPMQQSSSLATLERFDRLIRHFMSLLGFHFYAEVRWACKQILWHDRVMDPALRNILCGGL